MRQIVKYIIVLFNKYIIKSNLTYEVYFHIYSQINSRLCILCYL